MGGIEIVSQSLANEKFELLKKNHHHPSLRLKKIRNYWSVRAGLNYRALGIDTPDEDGIIWFWIGNHSDYEKLLNPKQVTRDIIPRSRGDTLHYPDQLNLTH
jgi:hypothetical protein